ncbi:E3 ubiquitin-protein ligase rnf168 isoform X1 [Brachyistius frenatus]|uniref:E3 ubiquitin-protein ligase rnf168 isoform X1 n=2 Tax=Brachyistius frenatus TaxID=100188 RepID=UPI0037E7327F
MAPVLDKRSREGALSRDDCLCPVCLEIFMEPVTLPCTHTFCKGCFLESVDKTTQFCPMCRKRVSTWARLNTKNNTMVNQQLWRQIQTCFPLQCQRRLTGQDADDTDRPVSLCLPRVSLPGEVRQEYEDQITKLTEERRVLEEEERRASEEYIQSLLAQEEQLRREERKTREEDEQLARVLSNQLNPPPVSQDTLHPDVKKEVVGQIEKFLCPRPAQTSSDRGSASSFVSNKENILLRPETQRPPPQLHGDGRTDVHPATEEEEEELHRSPLIRQGQAKRKSSETTEEVEEEEEVATKRGCSSSSSQGAELKAELEAELQVRLQQQEEEDRRLALLLQKELDQEEKHRATDRRKGTADAYLLRHNRRGSVTSTLRNTAASSSSGDTNNISMAFSPKTLQPSSASFSSSSSYSSSSSFSSTSSSSSSSSTTRGTKQTTLTDMFSSLSSCVRPQ